MQEDQNEWAKPENPEVEQSKEAFTEFAQAQQAKTLREKITQYAIAAVQHGGVDRDWANGWLVRLGAEPVTGVARYKLNVPVTGNYGVTISANSRAEALDKFNQIVANTAAAGQITNGYSWGVYGVEFPGGEPTFFSGPADPPQPEEDGPTGTALKAGIRQMLREGITERGWAYSYAVEQLDEMGLVPLPERVYRTVNVPVTGVAQMSVAVFVGDDEQAVERAAENAVVLAKKVTVTPDEVGSAYSPRSGGMQMNLVDDGSDD